MLKRLRLARSRARVARTSGHAGLAQLMAQPLPPASQPWRDVRYVALDFETTGLDPASDAIIAAGWVPVQNGCVQPGQGGYCLVQTEAEVGQSATVHGLTDAQLRAGRTPAMLFERLLEVLENSVLVVHHAPLDIGLLTLLSKTIAGAGLHLPVIDTLAMARASLRLRDRLPGSGELRLDALRQTYGLPRYASHHGLTDALATGELFTAMVKHRHGDGARLGDLWP